MRLGISNIAWDVAEDEAVARLLQCHDIDAIDIAPGKYFPRPAEAGAEDLLRVKQWWTDRGIEITGMQSLLFGSEGLNLFGGELSRAALLGRLADACRIGGLIGAPRLVFGAPKNRDRSGLDDPEAFDRGVAFFRQLGPIAASHGVVFCLEPVPPCYGANFMTTTAETARVVEAVAHPSIRMQLDTGALALNGEDPASVISRWAGLIGHIHASEPGLVPLGDGNADHGAVYRALEGHLPPDPLVSIEMLAPRDEPGLTAIKRALAIADRFYRPRDLNPT